MNFKILAILAILFSGSASFAGFYSCYEQETKKTFFVDTSQGFITEPQAQSHYATDPEVTTEGSTKILMWYGSEQGDLWIRFSVKPVGDTIVAEMVRIAAGNQAGIWLEKDSQCRKLDQHN